MQSTFNHTILDRVCPDLLKLCEHDEVPETPVVDYNVLLGLWIISWLVYHVGREIMFGTLIWGKPTVEKAFLDLRSISPYIIMETNYKHGCDGKHGLLALRLVRAMLQEKNLFDIQGQASQYSECVKINSNSVLIKPNFHDKLGSIIIYPGTLEDFQRRIKNEPRNLGKFYLQYTLGLLQGYRENPEVVETMKEIFGYTS